MERSVTASKDLSNFVFRAPTALATIANVRKEESTVAATITRVDMVSWYSENLLKTNTTQERNTVTEAQRANTAIAISAR